MCVIKMKDLKKTKKCYRKKSIQSRTQKGGVDLGSLSVAELGEAEDLFGAPDSRDRISHEAPPDDFGDIAAPEALPNGSGDIAAPEAPPNGSGDIAAPEAPVNSESDDIDNNIPNLDPSRSEGIPFREASSYQYPEVSAEILQEIGGQRNLDKLRKKSQRYWFRYQNDPTKIKIFTQEPPPIPKRRLAQQTPEAEEKRRQENALYWHTRGGGQRANLRRRTLRRQVGGPLKTLRHKTRRYIQWLEPIREPNNANPGQN
jgi:hypothetical protein